MALKTGIFSLALGALLLGSTAQAADAQARHGASSVVAQDFRGPGHGRGYNDGRNHRQNQNGRYELRWVQQWVPGQYQQVWVAEDCSDSSRRYVRPCQGGHYAQKWVPGHYERVEQWVWVPGGKHGHRRG